MTFVDGSCSTRERGAQPSVDQGAGREDAHASLRPVILGWIGGGFQRIAMSDTGSGLLLRVSFCPTDPQQRERHRQAILTRLEEHAAAPPGASSVTVRLGDSFPEPAIAVVYQSGCRYVVGVDDDGDDIVVMAIQAGASGTPTS